MELDLKTIYQHLRIVRVLALCALCSATLHAQGEGSTVASKAKSKTALVGPGSHGRKLVVDKVERSYRLYIPKRKSKDARPLLLMLHGRGSSGRQAERWYGFTRLADEHGFVAAFPDALGKPRSWEPGYFKGMGRRSDVRFLDRLITTLCDELRLDRSRVYCCGHSSGGIMSFAAAGAIGDKLAAIGSVAGTIGFTRGKGKPLQTNDLETAVPAIVFHARDDRVVPYDQELGKGARWNFFVSAPDSVKHFVSGNALPERASVKKLFGGNVTHSRWHDAKRGVSVEFYDIVKGGHGWPSAGRNGRRPLPNASREIWRFFKEHRRKSKSAHEERTLPIKAKEGK